MKKVFPTNTFFFAFVLFSTAFSQTGGAQIAERFRWRGYPEPVVHAALAAICAVIAIIIAACVFQVKNKKKNMREYINVQFIRKAKEAGLNIAQQTMLKSITWAVAPQMYSDVFNSLFIFENAVNAEISKLIKNHGENGKRTNDTANMISTIRKKLGFDKLIPEKALESSRNIEFGQEISLYNPPGETFIGKTRLLSNNELYFEADFSVLDDFFLHNKNENLTIAKFTRFNDAGYSIPLVIRSVNTNENIISFYHTTALERKQVRKYARISVDMPIQCKIIKRTDAENPPHAGETMKDTVFWDISGGGLAFRSKEPLTPDDIIMISFALNKEKFVMKGKIVATSAKDSNNNVYYKHRVMFYNSKPNDTERIVKFIYEKQREKIQFR